jgi:hypothetical protein
MKKKVIVSPSVGIRRGVCFKCNQKIDVNSNYLKLITMNSKQVIEEVWFHLPRCWGEYNQQKINERVMQMVNQGMNIMKSSGMMV